ncbi:hypothetical protein [Pseudokineococcus sp. 1T1Z-3]|uniref:hypothetical protein n=1 Tax=Pseudokineococcus sp. 1T1Z-3 TaxID=3132745 RepID=UPI0030B7336C
MTALLACALGCSDPAGQAACETVRADVDRRVLAAEGIAGDAVEMALAAAGEGDGLTADERERYDGLVLASALAQLEPSALVATDEQGCWSAEDRELAMARLVSLAQDAQRHAPEDLPRAAP